MTKNEVVNDMRFRSKCSEFGLDWENFQIYEDMIIVNSPQKNISLLLDDKYHTMGIINIKDESTNKEQEALKHRELYNGVNKDAKFLYPFQNFSLRQINEISSLIFIYHHQIMVYGKYVSDSKQSLHLPLLLYVNFLSKQIEQYFLNSYHMQMLGFDYPDVYSYVRALMTNMEIFIAKNLSEGNTPNLIDIAESLGNNVKDMQKYETELYYIIDLFTREFDGEGKSQDLSSVATDLLKVMEIPNLSRDDRFFENADINLESWLTRDNSLQRKLHL